MICASLFYQDIFAFLSIYYHISIKLSKESYSCHCGMEIFAAALIERRMTCLFIAQRCGLWTCFQALQTAAIYAVVQSAYRREYFKTSRETMSKMGINMHGNRKMQVPISILHFLFGRGERIRICGLWVPKAQR